ncbi:hypothetical protein EPIB1_2968 [Tritonibacter mobilis]|nr:hypothetical protein EPIB1_2968 [Tritonibacter mobilis]
MALVQLYTEAAGREDLATSAMEKLIARPNGQQNLMNHDEKFVNATPNLLKGHM